MRLFHRIDLSGKEPDPVYLRVEDIQYVMAYSPEGEPGCTVRLRGWGAARDKYDMGASMRLAESAEEVIRACGYNVVQVPSVSADATLILAGALRAELDQAKAAVALESIPRIIERDEGYIHGMERAIEIVEGRA